MIIPPQHEAARALAAAGIPVFPCVPDRKEPLTRHGFMDRSADLAQIDAWWQQWPTANLAVVPEDIGCMVIDVDAGGDAGLVDLMLKHGDELPDTRTHSTPSGGRHLIYRGSAPPSAKRLAPGVDTRGRGSYVLWPGSVVAGIPYTVLDDRQPAQIPGWLAPLVEKPEREARERVDGIEWNTARALRDAYDYIDRSIANGDIPTHGSRNDHAFRWFAHVVKGLAITGDKAKELYGDFLAQSGGAIPDGWPDDPKIDDIIARLENEQVGDNPTGSERSRDATDLYRPELAPQDDGGPRTLNGTDLDDTDLGPDIFEACADPPLVTAEHPELVPGWIERNIVTYQEGSGGVGKSYIAQQDAACIAAGVKLYGQMPEQCDVLYLNYEEPREEWLRRLHRIRSYYGPEPTVDGLTKREWNDRRLGTWPIERVDKRPLDTSRLTAVHLRQQTGAHIMRVTRQGQIILTRFGRRLRDRLALSSDLGNHTYVVLDGLIDAVLFEGSTRSEDDVARQVIALLDRWCVDYDLTASAIIHPSQAGARAGGDSYAPAWATKPRARQSFRRCTFGGKAISRTEWLPPASLFTRREVTKRSHGKMGGFIDYQFNGSVWAPTVETGGGHEEPINAAVRLAIAQAQQDAPIKHDGSTGAKIGDTTLSNKHALIVQYRQAIGADANVENFVGWLKQEAAGHNPRIYYQGAPSGANGKAGYYPNPAYVAD